MMFIEDYNSLKLQRIVRKIERSTYYNITIFSQFVVAPTRYHQCYDGSEKFSQHYHIIKSGPFEEFLNWSNVDELVIHSMSGCNCKNYKLKDNNYKLNNNLA